MSNALRFNCAPVQAPYDLFQLHLSGREYISSCLRASCNRSLGSKRDHAEYSFVRTEVVAAIVARTSRVASGSS
jgi:hypothetical protein